MAKLQTKIKQKICGKQIFDVLTFSGFFAGFDSDFLKFSRFWAQKAPKIQKKVKIPKVCFVQIFYLIFVCNLAKNGLIWVFWPKVISFFRFWNSNFFRGISYKDTRSFFIRKLRFRLHIEKYYTNLFSFLIFHTNCWRGYIYFLIDDFLIKKACTHLSNE